MHAHRPLGPAARVTAARAASRGPAAELGTAVHAALVTHGHTGGRLRGPLGGPGDGTDSGPALPRNRAW